MEMADLVILCDRCGKEVTKYEQMEIANIEADHFEVRVISSGQFHIKNADDITQLWIKSRFCPKCYKDLFKMIVEWIAEEKIDAPKESAAEPV